MLTSQSNNNDTILSAIISEAENMGIPKTFVAFILKIYNDNQELSRCIEGLMHSQEWQFKKLEKWISALEEKVDPEKAAQRKNQICESAGSACRIPKKGILG